MSVLLPAPFSPIKARTSPASTPSETPSSARVAPNDLVTSRISRSTAASLRRSVTAVSTSMPGPVEGPQHSEGARLVGAEDPVDLSAVARHQALGLLLRRVGRRAGVFRVRQQRDPGEVLGERVGEALLALLGALRADRVPQQDDLALAPSSSSPSRRAASTPPW